LKLSRAYHLARGESNRWIVISRWGSYHGNTLGALDLSGRRPLRRPYEDWLGRFRHVSTPYPYRDGEPGAHALASGTELAAELERTIEAPGRARSRPSSPSRSSGRRWRPPSRPTTTGRSSRTSAAGTGCC
jgi:adenosylmethionine-8-amino-7-oxononanoate aminotransferase